MVNAESLTGKAVVFGAGTMGGGIAADLANAGWTVDLLDVVSGDPNRSEVARVGLERVKAARPPLLTLPDFAERLRPGNTEDDLHRLRQADWVIEAVPEDPDLKRAVMALIEAHAGPEALVSSNTSGLSLSEMVNGCSPEFRQRFLGTHFLNPPRYVKLLEVIPLPETDPDLVGGFHRFAEQVLGHRVVFARDTPGFISTRIGIWHLIDTIHRAIETGLTVEEVDVLTGPFLGRPKSGTFRLADLIGLDVLAGISRDQCARLGGPMEDRIALPPVMEQMLAEGRLGAKTGEGFYRREGGEILALDLATGDYRPRRAEADPEVAELLRKPLSARLREIRQWSETPRARFLNGMLDALDAYVRRVGPEVARSVMDVDRAMQWGYNWEMGPFEMADAASPQPKARAYRGAGAERTFYSFRTGRYEPVPHPPEYISLTHLKLEGRLVRHSGSASLIDLGDGVACLEYHSKMNTFSPEMCAFADEAREIAERDFQAMVVGSEAAHFSAGYDLRRFLDAMAAGDWECIDRELRLVQSTFLGWKRAKVPVVAAPHGYTLGAGCEGALHCAAIQAAPDLRMGLPEASIGVVPAGGGTSEMLLRAMDGWDGASDPFPRVARLWELLSFPITSSSAEEARRLGFLRPADAISRNADRQLYDAKQRALALADGYVPPGPERVWVMGPDGLARIRMRLHDRFRSGAITEHDRLIADRIAWILCGGDLPHAQEVSEEYLKRLEREAFIRLAHQPETAERMRTVVG